MDRKKKLYIYQNVSEFLKVKVLKRTSPLILKDQSYFQSTGV